MILKNKYFFIVFFLSLFNNLSAQEIKEKTEQIIKSAFGKEADYKMIKYQIPVNIKKEIESEVKQVFFDESVFIYKIFEGEKIIGFGILDNVYGKSLPITFLVLFSREGNIISTDIIKYREAYGGAVSNKTWNDQFKGKNSVSSYEINKDISSISGATISVNSVTKGVEKSAILLHKIKDKL